MNDQERIDWIQKEVYRHGVVKLEASDTYVDVNKTGLYSARRDGKFVGFSVTSQHIGKGKECLNIRQLIDEMARHDQPNR